MEAQVPLRDAGGKTVAVAHIRPQRGQGPESLQVVSAETAMAHNEVPVQLLEGRRYEYRVVAVYPCRLRENAVIFRSPFANDVDAGTILPGMHTGRVRLVLEDASGNEIATGAVEVRAAKLSYREDYRHMLDDIARRSQELLLQLYSPAELSLKPDPNRDPVVLQQQFYFLRALIQSDDFRAAIERILAAPYQRTALTTHEVDPRRKFRATPSTLRQLAARPDRSPLPLTHPLSARLPSVPHRVSVESGMQDFDTPENRFVKFVLQTFFDFSQQTEVLVRKADPEQAVGLLQEVVALRSQLGELLTHGFFAGVGPLQANAIASPVLQRRAGYREVLQVWLRFNAAARLTWEGGEDVFAGGKRDVATLYEYWAFLVLAEAVAGTFGLPVPAMRNLVERSADRYALRLKAGETRVLEGEARVRGRSLRVEFAYNRTFEGSVEATPGGKVSNYPREGSWTRRMRPDYTLTVWPAAYSRDAAEKAEAIVHIHFDAKYRVENLQGLFGTDAQGELDEERVSSKRGLAAKRADLLRMHAYRDAIRRSAGAYVLYPGEKQSHWSGFHELLPGLGAFPLRPGAVGNDAAAIRAFLHDVATQLADRTSQLETRTYAVYQNEKQAKSPLFFPLPERDSAGERQHLPSMQIGVVEVSDPELSRAQSTGDGILPHPATFSPLPDLWCATTSGGIFWVAPINRSTVTAVNGTALVSSGWPSADPAKVYAKFSLHTDRFALSGRLRATPGPETRTLADLLALSDPHA